MRARALLGLLLVASIIGAVSAQQMMPFAGNADEPDEPTTVYVSTYIDRLMFIDDKNYEFQALVFVYLSWTDPRARKTVEANRVKLAANSSASCKIQCQLYPQNQQNPSAGCCDDVWTPYVSFSSLKMLSQDRVMRWGINVEPGSDSVAYWSITLGTFMASFDLRAFPFDVQRLHVQMEIPGWAGGNVRLQPSSGGTRMFNTNPDGDALSGWRVMAVRMSTYNLSLCQRYTVASSQPSAAGDPAPLVSDLLYTDKRIKASPGSCAAVLDKKREDPSFLVYTRQNLDGSPDRQNQPLNVTGVTCTIVVKRYVAQWVMSAILPIVASTWLGFVVFLLPRDCINSRLGAVMTIFVAVAAIQFVVAQDLPNSSYMTALQQLIAAGYVVLILIATEAVIIWWITTYHQTGKRLKEHQEAHKHFEAKVKSELGALRAQLATMLAEQDSKQVKPSLSRSLSNMRALTMSRTGKFGKVQRAGSGSSRTASNTSTDERSAAAALAVAAADRQCAQAGAQRDSTAANTGYGSAGSAAATLDAPRAGADTQKRKDVQLAFSELNRLEQQLAAPKQQEQQLLLQKQLQQQGAAAGQLGVQNLAAGSAAAADAPSTDGSVLLLMSPDGVGESTAGHSWWFMPWRWFTRMRLYVAALQQDETLTDELSYQLNKWVGIIQFMAYNVTVILIFVVNYTLYSLRRS